MITIAFLFQYILTDDEVKIKTKLWMDLNGEFLKEMRGGQHSSFIKEIFLPYDECDRCIVN